MRVRLGNGRMEWNAMERIFDAEEENMSERKNEQMPGGRENLRAWRCSGMVEYPKKFVSKFFSSDA
jgi:hypothetical protein